MKKDDNIFFQMARCDYIGAMVILIMVLLSLAFC